MQSCTKHRYFFVDTVSRNFSGGGRRGERGGGESAFFLW